MKLAGTSGIHLFQPSAHAETPRTDYPAPHLAKFWMSPQMEIPQPLWAIRFSTVTLAVKMYFFTLRWNFLCFTLCPLPQFSLHPPFSYLHTHIFLSASHVRWGLTSTEQRKRITSLKPTGNILPNANSHSSVFFIISNEWGHALPHHHLMENRIGPSIDTAFGNSSHWHTV